MEKRNKFAFWQHCAREHLNYRHYEELEQEIKLILKARGTKYINFIPNPVKVDFL